MTSEQRARFMAARGVARQKTPELLVTVEAIPMNSTGKVDERGVLALSD